MPLFLILALPLAEIATFIVVGDAIGVLRTLTLIAIASAVGFVMLRDAGIMTAFRLQRQTVGQGRHADQAAILAEGGTRMLAGLLLLIPGFLTDLAALAILIPPVRNFLLRAVRLPAAPAPGTGEKPSAAGDVIDGDFRRLDG